jgi:hypothetical protein
MKNRYGVEYTFVKYDDKLYRFNMSEEGMKYSRYGGKEGQEGIDPNDLGFFDPSGGPFVAIGSKIYWDEIHEWCTKKDTIDCENESWIVVLKDYLWR